MTISNCNYPVYMHVNYLESVYPANTIVAHCARAGYDGVELRGFDRTNERTLEQYLAWTHELTQQHSLGLVYGCIVPASSNNDEERSKALKDLETVIAFAGKHDIRTINICASTIVAPGALYCDFHLNGSTVATDQEWRRTVDLFRKAGDLAGEHNVSLCFETHNCYIHDLADPTVELLRRIDRPSVKVTLDIGNILVNRLNKGLDTELDMLAEHVAHVHLKNMHMFYQRFNSNIYMPTGLADGDINNFTFVRTLVEKGYRGILTIENNMAGDKRHYMTADLAYLRSILKDMEIR